MKYISRHICMGKAVWDVEDDMVAPARESRRSMWEVPKVTTCSSYNVGAEPTGHYKSTHMTHLDTSAISCSCHFLFSRSSLNIHKCARANKHQRERESLRLFTRERDKRSDNMVMSRGVQGRGLPARSASLTAGRYTRDGGSPGEVVGGRCPSQPGSC